MLRGPSSYPLNRSNGSEFLSRPDGSHLTIIMCRAYKSRVRCARPRTACVPHKRTTRYSMARQLVLLVLAFGVMLSHLAAAPHLHPAGARNTGNTDTRAHFHFSQFVPDLGAPGNLPTAPKANHDADAWYLDDATLAAGDSADADVGQAVNVFATAQFTSVLLARPDRTTAPAPARPLVCPLFVRHRALLI